MQLRDQRSSERTAASSGAAAVCPSPQHLRVEALIVRLEAVGPAPHRLQHGPQGRGQCCAATRLAHGPQLLCCAAGLPPAAWRCRPPSAPVDAPIGRSARRHCCPQCSGPVPERGWRALPSAHLLGRIAGQVLRHGAAGRHDALQLVREVLLVRCELGALLLAHAPARRGRCEDRAADSVRPLNQREMGAGMRSRGRSTAPVVTPGRGCTGQPVGEADVAMLARQRAVLYTAHRLFALTLPTALLYP